MRKSKFVSIYHDLSEKILKKKIDAGALLPTENELCAQYHASRETIRKALAMLSRNGYIQKVQGKGSIVLDVSRQNFPISGLTSFRELAAHSKRQWTTDVHQVVLLNPDEHLKMMMNLQDEQTVWQVVRSRSTEGESVILDRDYLIQEVVPLLTADQCAHSLYDYIENDLGLKIGFAKKEITVESANEEDYRYLTMHEGTHVVVVRSLVYLENAQLFQYTESRHRADKFRFVDFARRDHM